MDERTLKRLAVIVAASIAMILLAKWGLTKTYTTLNEAAAAKKQVSKPAVTQQAPALPEEAGAPEAPAAPGVDGEGAEGDVAGEAPAELDVAEPASEPPPDASSGDATE